MEPRIQVEKLSSSLYQDRRSMITTAKVVARVRRPVSEIGALMRPEAWMSDPSFRAVYPVRRDAMGEPSCRANRGGGFVFERAVSRGSDADWSALYYEHVEVKMAIGGTAEFHNLLDIEFRLLERGVELTFGLHQCLASRWGVLRRAGGLDVDRGHLRVVAVRDGYSEIEATKSVRYTPFANAELAALGAPGMSENIVNEVAPIFLGPWMESLVLAGCSYGSSAPPSRRVRGVGSQRRAA
jgi:hypothetical protein